MPCSQVYETGEAVDDAVALQQRGAPNTRDIALLMGSGKGKVGTGWLNRPDGGCSFLRDREGEIWTLMNVDDFMSLGPQDKQQGSFSLLLDGALLDIYHRAWGRRGDASPL
jgi:hypothetical protein